MPFPSSYPANCARYPKGSSSLKVPSLFFIVIIMSGLIFLDADMIAERIGMMFISFVIYDLYKYTSEIEDRIIRSFVRLSLMLLFTLPTLFFESSIKFLM